MQGSFAFFYVGEISGSQINFKLQFLDFHATTLAQNFINKGPKFVEIYDFEHFKFTTRFT